MRGVGCVRGGLATALPPYALGLACAARRAMHRARVALIKEVGPRLVALGQTLGALEDLQRRPSDVSTCSPGRQHFILGDLSSAQDPSFFQSFFITQKLCKFQNCFRFDF